MGNVIIFIIIAIITIVNVVKNYNKEKSKNKGRVITKPSMPQTQGKSTPPPFSRKAVPEINKEVVIEEIQQPEVEKSAIQTQMDKYLLATEFVEINKVDDSLDEHCLVLDEVSENDQFDDRKGSIDLELSTPLDYRRAFIHSLIFERKY